MDFLYGKKLMQKDVDCPQPTTTSIAYKEREPKNGLHWENLISAGDGFFYLLETIKSTNVFEEKR